MSNEIARASQNLTLRAKRLALIAIAHIKRNQRQAERTTITAKEYGDTYGIDRAESFRQLSGAADDFLRRYVTIRDEDGHVRKRPWVQECVYIEGQSKVEIEWSKYVAPHLIELEKRFTRFQLEQVRNLRSIYSVRLLELIAGFRDTGWMQISIEDFGRAMDATEKQMANFNNLKRRMIEPAITELAEKDGLIVAWEPIKRGRKVASLKFTFAKEPQKRLPLEQPRQPRARTRAAETLPAPAPGPRLRGLADFKDKPLSALPSSLIASEIGPKAQAGESWDAAWDRIRQTL